MIRRRFIVAPWALALVVASCAPTEQRAAGGADSGSAVARQPLPAGVDPRMVEWRSDGLIVPSADSLRKTPGYVVDSVFPPDEAIRRFQATVVGPRPARLVGGAPDAETLLRRYWAALVRSDTIAIRALVVSHAEFAHLYFPESAVFASGMQPTAAWLLYEAQTGRGLSRAFREAAGKDSSIVSTVCRSRERIEGQSRTFGPCAVVRRRGTGSDTLWIGNTLIARDGVIKFLSLDNSL